MTFCIFAKERQSVLPWLLIHVLVAHKAGAGRNEQPRANRAANGDHTEVSRLQRTLQCCVVVLRALAKVNDAVGALTHIQLADNQVKSPQTRY
jgi:hypothetical protein